MLEIGSTASTAWESYIVYSVWEYNNIVIILLKQIQCCRSNIFFYIYNNT